MGEKSLKGPRCAACESHRCVEGADCFGARDGDVAAYGPEDLAMLRGATRIESHHYGQATRLEETVLFMRTMGWSRLGLAFCIGMKTEAASIAAFFEAHGLEVVSVCCKVDGVDKESMGLELLRKEGRESMCNPVAQARRMNEAGVDLAVICGLCVGHDALFTRHTEAPVTTLVAKDRVLAHNPVAAVTCPYVAKRRGRPL